MPRRRLTGNSHHNLSSSDDETDKCLAPNYCNSSGTDITTSGSSREDPPRPSLTQRSWSVDTLDRQQQNSPPPSPTALGKAGFKRKHSFDLGTALALGVAVDDAYDPPTGGSSSSASSPDRSSRVSTAMSHLPPSLDNAMYATQNASTINARRRRQRRLRAMGSSLALLCGTLVLFGDTLQGSLSSLPLSGIFGSLSSSETIVKRSLRAVEDNVKQSRRVLRDTVAWKRVPRMMLATDLAALAAEEEERLLQEVKDDGDGAGDTKTTGKEDKGSKSTSSSSSSTSATGLSIKPIRKRRMAVVRPFGPNNAAELEESFRLWDTHWPCSANHLTSSEHSDEFQIDLYLLFSRTFDPTVHPDAIALATELQNKFASNNGWNGCFSRLFKFEADIVPSDDNYDKSVHSGFNKEGESLEHRDIMWVNGPNESFRKVTTVLGGLDGRTIDGILPTSSTDAEGSNAARDANQAATRAAADYWSNFGSNADGGDGEGAFAASASFAAAAAGGLTEVDGYELVSILEPDVRPRRAGWLDDIIDEIHAKEPFAMLGSTYKGHAWDNFKSELPSSLLNHLNGNAHYNMTHPLFLHLLSELNAEAGSHYSAIPYDYRISQMTTEGRDGIPPEFPFPDMKDPDTGGSIILAAKGDKFRRWWDLYGPTNSLTSPDGISPMKESDVIANFAATDYLDEHLPAGDTEGVVVHGKGGWRQWNHEDHDITLVISDWDGQLLPSVIQSLSNVHHPYTEVIVMRPPPEERPPPSLLQRFIGLFGGNTDVKTVASHTGPNTINVKYVDRIHPDYMDLCSAPVRTNWFMTTNSYHALNPKGVDLMFTHPSSNAESSRPVIPYTPARSRYCSDYEACREIYDMARRFHDADDFDKIVLDMDMLYHTRSRDGFCGAWGEIHEADEENDDQANFPPLSSVAKRGPSATAYAAYLQRAGMAESIYQFSNQLLSGGKDAFTKIHREEEDEVRRRMAQEEDLLKLARLSGSVPLETLMGAASPGSDIVNNSPTDASPPTRSLADKEEAAEGATKNNNDGMAALSNKRRAQEEIEVTTVQKVDDEALRVLEGGNGNNDRGPQCALVYEEAKECGATGNIEDTCCDGLYCLGKQCTAPTECLGSSCINFRSRSLGGLVWSPPNWLVKS